MSSGPEELERELRHQWNSFFTAMAVHDALNSSWKLLTRRPAAKQTNRGKSLTNFKT